MGSGQTVGHYRFEGWDLPTKYGWMHEGPGVHSATQMQDLVHRMGQRMITSGDLVHGLLGGADWSGAAASAAGEAMQRGAVQITQTAAEAATAKQCVVELSDSFSLAQNSVPSPNEIPSGLGDKFLDGAATAFNAVSPFDVQSPIHQAMAQRRELDEQANQALTTHMTISRERVDAIPVVTAPAPITVAARSSAPGGGGGVAPPTWGSAPSPRRATAPSSTHSAGVGAGSVPAPTGQAGAGSVPFPPGGGPAGTSPAGTGPASTGSAAAYGSPQYGTAAAGSATAGAAMGAPAFGLGSGGESARGASSRRSGLDAGAAAAAGRPGGFPGRGAAEWEGAGRSAAAGRLGALGEGAGRGSGSFMQPPVGGTGSGEDDAEHKDRYAQAGDHLVGELPLVAPAVIGETPEEEANRIGLALDGQ
jgi:hypothetical protein